jgi:hypothetical protein
VLNLALLSRDAPLSAAHTHVCAPLRRLIISSEDFMTTKVSTLDAPPVPDNSNFTAPRPTPEEIAVRAHQIFEERGGIPGFDFDDWLQAERELKLAANLKASAQKSAVSAASATTLRSLK